ncbi:MAG: RDD family protein [Thermoproteota archaeon]
MSINVPSTLPPPPPTATAPNYATIVDRFVAVLIDTIVSLLATLILSIPFGIFSMLPGMRYLFGPSTWIGFFIWVFYFGYFEGTSGQTIGKQIIGIKVVDEQTLAVVDIGRALIRNVIRIIDFLPLFYIIGILLISTNPKKQRLGDMIAKTVVLKI